MASMTNPHDEIDVRISDDERQRAMASLGRAMSEGRISVDEYDERVQIIAKAKKRNDVEEVFTDLPQNASGTTGEVDKMYSSREVALAHQRSRKVRLGLLGLTTVGSLAGVGILGTAGVAWSPALLTLIPIVWIMLYLLKVGPASWYTPSPRQIERERRREIESAEAYRNAERKAQAKAEAEERRMRRQQLAGEITNDAMYFAQKGLNKFKK